MKLLHVVSSTGVTLYITPLFANITDPVEGEVFSPVEIIKLNLSEIDQITLLGNNGFRIK